MAFTVYKSSAGSGKTYTLVRDYLKLVLLQPEKYRNVLAITFTNKAANEMKERIIQVLKGISDLKDEQAGNSNRMLADQLSGLTGLDRTPLIQNAARVLSLILHNYNEFAVSTIDSFVHRIIRSFAFDLNVPVNFKVELETDEVFKQVVDVLISRVGSDKDLTTFLVDFVRSRAEEEKNWHIENDLLNIAMLLKREDSLEFLPLNKELRLNDYIRIGRLMRKEIAAFEQTIEDYGKQGLEAINSRNIRASAFFAGAKTGIAGWFQALADCNLGRLNPSAKLENAIADDRWSSTSSTAAEQATILEIKDQLQDVYGAVRQFVEKRYSNYVLYKEMLKNLYPLAVLDLISDLLEDYKSENNLLLISEFNQLIAEIVLDEPVPFIYERVGEKFSHFLVDEFQDTSVLQWQNLLPLIDNSLALGQESLIVGDAKQAIYRWRNGEVEQFARLPEVFRRKPGQIHLERENALRSNYVERVLEHNYRSMPGIVRFNNSFFDSVRNCLSENDRGIYENQMQRAALDGDDGYVRFDLYDKENDIRTFDEYNLDQVLTIVEEVRAQGYRYSDVAILCRKNAEGGMLANHLLENQIPVVSKESVLLKSSPKVRLVVTLMHLIQHPTDPILAVQMIRLLIHLDLIKSSLQQASDELRAQKRDAPDAVFGFLNTHGFTCSRRKFLLHSLYDLSEELLRLFSFHASPDPFMQFFLDVVLEQSAGQNSDLSDFLEYWDKKKDALSILLPEGMDAIRILTIHKAKGLEFPVVIYPMIREGRGSKNPLVWVQPELEEFPEFRAALVQASRELSNTRFGPMVNRENEKALLDRINLMYVAFTRPTDQLYVLASLPGTKSNSTSIAGLILYYLQHAGLWSEGQLSYEFGHVPGKKKDADLEHTTYTLNSFISEEWPERAQLSYQAPLNWEVETPQERQEWGNLIHFLLSRIKVQEDLPQVLGDLFFKGMIRTPEKELLQEMVDEFLNRPSVAPYFKKGITVMTEAEIIAPGGALYRPDRIVQDGKQLTVIDFKTGAPAQAHVEQMKRYVQVVRALADQQVEGVLLYLNEKDPVVVRE